MRSYMSAAEPFGAALALSRGRCLQSPTVPLDRASSIERADPIADSTRLS